MSSMVGIDPTVDKFSLVCGTEIIEKGESLSDKRQVKVTISTNDVDRDGDIVEPKGADLRNYRRNPIVLYNHKYDHPVARCVDIQVKATSIEAIVEFPPEGTSEKADEVYGLLKSGILNATSIGFRVTKYDYLYEESGNANSPVTGLHIKEWELREFSIVSVPANPNALVIERSAGIEVQKSEKDQEKPKTEAPSTDPTPVVVAPIQRMRREAELLRLRRPGV